MSSVSIEVRFKCRIESGLLLSWHLERRTNFMDGSMFTTGTQSEMVLRFTLLISRCSREDNLDNQVISVEYMISMESRIKQRRLERLPSCGGIIPLK
jgi:hypothetical protein